MCRARYILLYGAMCIHSKKVSLQLLSRISVVKVSFIYQVESDSGDVKYPAGDLLGCRYSCIVVWSVVW